MKVLVAEANAAARGGAELYAARLMDVLTRMGHAAGHLDISGHRPPGAPRPALPARPGPSLWAWSRVCRALPPIARDYDAVILAYGEGPGTGRPTLAIRHAPALFSDRPDLIACLGARATPQRRAYHRFCRARTRPDPTLPSLANTRWTAAMMHRDGARARAVLYPPIDAAPPPPGPRDPHHILALGRIVPAKRLPDAVAICDALRALGHPVTLQIMGRGTGRSLHALQRLARTRPWLTLSTDATDAERSAALSRATLGLHCCRGEHFGIAVAEMIGAGILPLVHDSGGVCELVTPPALRWRDPGAAVRAAAGLLSDPARHAHLRQSLQAGAALAAARDFDARAAALLADWLEGAGRHAA